MGKYSDNGLSPAELAAMSDDDIDYSDIPELTEEFFAKARRVYPDGAEDVTLRLPRSALQAFRAQGDGYERIMSAILERHAQQLSR